MGGTRHRNISSWALSGFKKRGAVCRGGPVNQAFALVLGILLLASFSTPAAADGEQKIKVMTQNLYVGADLDRISNVSSLYEIPEAAAVVYGIIQASNFWDRADALADQIAFHMPDLIGLQEVTLIRRQSPSDFIFEPPGNPSYATTVELDFLNILLDELDERGLDYREVATVDDFDIELPMFVGFDEWGLPLLDDIRVTDRDVILAREHVETSNVKEERYQHLYAALGLLPIYRGYVAVDAEIGEDTFRFVSTHLEVRENPLGVPLQYSQAQELMEDLSLEELPIILVGDFNSAPVEGSNDTYNLITGEAAGFVDIFEIRPKGPRGLKDGEFTCCQDEFLLNDTSELYERVDHIFLGNGLRTMPFSLVGPASADIIGDEEGDKTITGLWPSDHAGVVGTMVIEGLWDLD